MSRSDVHSCRGYRARLDGILDGMGSIKSRQEVEEHAEHCSACADELRRVQEMRRWIDSTPEPELAVQAEDEFVQAVLGRLDRSSPVTVPAAPGWGRVLSGRWGAGAAAVLAAAALALLYLWPGNLPAKTESEATDPRELNAVETGQAATPSPYVGASLPVELEPEYATLPEPAVVDLVALSGALEGLRAGPGRADADLLSRDWFAAITREFGSEGAVRGARAILRDPDAAALAPLAARLLGPRADLRDRRLLMETLPVTGMAGSLALAERGPSGFEILWRLASTDSTDTTEDRVVRGELAAKALMRWSQAGHAVLAPSLDLSANIPLAAELIAASGRGGGVRLLDQFLDDGRAEWLDAWASRPDRIDALESRVGVRSNRQDPRWIQRMLAAIERSRYAGATEFVLDALEEGHATAAATLASMTGVEPFEALLGSSSAGRLRSEMEDAAWAEFVRLRPDDLLGWLVELPAGPGREDNPLIPRLALTVDECPAARRLLALASLEPSLAVEPRVRALLYAVDGLQEGAGDESPLFGGSIRRALRELTRSKDPRLAAAAWIACRRLGEDPGAASPEISRALDRAATGGVQHLRVVRAIERSRAAAFGRASRRPN